MKSPSLFLGSLLLLGAAFAQQPESAPESPPDSPAEAPGDAPAEAVRRYTTEIIIFAYAEDISVGSEIFVPPILRPDQAAGPAEGMDEDTDEDSEAVSEPDPADQDVRPVYPFTYVRLKSDELTMTDNWSKLDRLDAYQPLMHFGWTQPAIAEDQTPTLSLERFGRPPQSLDGSLKLSLSRYLHLDVDISLAAPEAEVLSAATMRSTETGAPVFGDERLQSTDGYGPGMLQYAPARYRISERRIMKNGDIRYFDHPKLGVIAKTTRFEEDATGQSAPR